MDSQVQVGSIDIFREFRATYSKFGDSARNALVAAELEIRRMLDWLEKDQVAYWKAEIRRREEKVNEAQTALHRKRITAAFGNIAADSEEILMLRRAQAKLAQAEAKLKEVKQWFITVEQAVQEYRGPVQQLGNMLDAGVPKALSSLDRMTDTIEAYLQVAAPTAGAEAAAATADLNSGVVETKSSADSTTAARNTGAQTS